MILIVDDEPMILEIFSCLLDDEGLPHLTARSGAMALEILEDRRLDLIITDFLMPGMTGIEFGDSVRTLEQHVGVPMILMSGAQADLGDARPDLFVEVLRKPFDLYRVLEKIKALVALRAL